MKKILSLLLVLTLVFILVACRNEKNLTSEPDTSTATQMEIENTDTDDVATGENSYNTEISSSGQPVSSSEPTKNSALNVHTHSFSAATCTEPAKCSCGDTDGTALGHTFKGDFCSICRAKNPEYKKPFDATINGLGCYVGDLITIDVILTTSSTVIENIWPTLEFYEQASEENWIPSNTVAKEVENGIRSMISFEAANLLYISSEKGAPVDFSLSSFSAGLTNQVEEFPENWDVSGYAETDFKNGKVIMRCTYPVQKSGKFKIEVSSYGNENYENALSLKVYK